HCGINLRLMRYSDVLLRAAECENEVNGPDQQAIYWINLVRERAGLADLKLSDFDTKDKLFEQIANVERPKEFGCEFGRGFDLIRWGFYLTKDRQEQLMDHEMFTRMKKADWKPAQFNEWQRKALKHSDLGSAIDSVGVNMKCSFDTYNAGHEFEPIVQTLINKNSNLVGNSANNSTSNAGYFDKNGWTIHPVVSLGK
ncbi:MAG: RagB/SusD family nutrient uptake outer membrane protein, partial [Prevotella sp.]|nr:RagB/SusD family nutrient uptake outer membrane protein [Prevotella sp.]